MRSPPRPPRCVDRLIVHQFDPARPSPGGIDTCLRGICAYFPDDTDLAIVGVDTGSGPADRHLGRWERYESPAGPYWFLPVARLDPGDQRRRIPHSLRLALGVLRYRGRLPKRRFVQAHRMDTMLALTVLLPGRRAYFVHTQDRGLTGSTSDSIWRFARRLHRALERWVVRRATVVSVFNPEYAEIARSWNPATRPFPTWHDPSLLAESTERDNHRVIWVGRMETPKDPMLAVRTFHALTAEAEGAWTLRLLGQGTLSEEVAAVAGGDTRVHLLGAVPPEQVYQELGGAGVFLMTSHPGYEGFPRVLVEALASGLPTVVTEGSDTGRLVENGRNGFTVGRDPAALAAAIRAAAALDRDAARASVAQFSGPAIVAALFAQTSDPDEARPHPSET